MDYLDKCYASVDTYVQLFHGQLAVRFPEWQ